VAEQKIIEKPKAQSTDCASMDQLLALARNQLPPSDAGRIRAHLDAGCAACKEQLDHFQMLVAAMVGRELVDLPAWLTHQGRKLFAWHKTIPRQDQTKPIPGILVTDSFADERLLGFRMAGPTSRQMLYRAEQHDVDLYIEYVKSADAFDIMGQVMPLSADLRTVAGAEVKLLKKSQIASSTKINEFGEFIFNGIGRGVYDLRLELSAGEIDIIGIDIVLHSQSKRVGQ
jgi:hypothetical protein